MSLLLKPTKPWDLLPPGVLAKPLHCTCAEHQAVAILLQGTWQWGLPNSWTQAGLEITLVPKWGLGSAWGAAFQPQPAKTASKLRSPALSTRQGLPCPKWVRGTRVYPGGLLSPDPDLQPGGLCPASQLCSAGSPPRAPRRHWLRVCLLSSGVKRHKVPWEGALGRKEQPSLAQREPPENTRAAPAHSGGCGWSSRTA